MRRSSPTRRTSHTGEDGYVLIAVIFLVALLTISLSIALPKVAKEIQRDRELETMQRGKQYIRAVRMYYKKFGAFPPNADAITKPTNNIRFLRKKYVDLTSGSATWKPVLFGQNKAPTAMGFFGQPLGGTGGCATNPLATNAGSGSSSFGSATGSTTDSSTNCIGAGLGTNATTATDGSAVNPTDPNAANGGSTAGGSAFGQPGQSFGGAGIMGFSPNSPKPSILVYKKKSHYNEWEFVYDPRAEMMQGGAPVNAPIQPGAPGINLPPGQAPVVPTPNTQ